MKINEVNQNTTQPEPHWVWLFYTCVHWCVCFKSFKQRRCQRDCILPGNICCRWNDALFCITTLKIKVGLDRLQLQLAARNRINHDLTMNFDYISYIFYCMGSVYLHILCKTHIFRKFPSSMFWILVVWLPQSTAQQLHCAKKIHSMKIIHNNKSKTENKVN